MNTSAAIRVVRPLLIILMSFAHIGILDQMSRINAATTLDFNNWMIVFLKACLAKSGVPLLSLISGYLAVVTLDRYGYFKVLFRKARRLVWPLFWFNLFFILLITYPAQALDPTVRSDLDIYPFNAMGWFQATFAYYRIPANEPLYFLKDLYTCFLLLPLLVMVARVKFLNIAVVAWMAYKCIYLQSAFLFEVFPLWFLRFDIVFAFYIGILLFYWKKELFIDNRKLSIGLTVMFPVIGGLASVMYVVLAKPEHLTLFLWADFIVKLFSVLGCIAIMSLLVGSNGRLSRFFAWLSPYSYTLFLTHLFSFTFFNQAYVNLFSAPKFFGLSGVVYLVAMLTAAIVVSVVLKTVWSRLVRVVFARARSEPG
jgi:succinoglycan biosynthesis protein ExoH